MNDSFLRRALPIAAIVAITLGTIAWSIRRFLEFPSFDFDLEQASLGRFLYISVLQILFFLALALPCLANLGVKKANQFANIGLVASTVMAVLKLVNLFFFQVLIPVLDAHFWLDWNLSHWCFKASILATGASLLCHTLISLCLCNKVIGYLAVPFFLVTAAAILLVLLEIRDDWFWVLHVIPTFAIVLLCSIATIQDEKNHQG